MKYHPLEQRIGHSFHATTLLEEALTHPSAMKPVNNQRLEFLGDAVLGFLIAELLYAMYPAEAEGDLARRHAALVRGETLAEVAREINLHSHLIFAAGEDDALNHRAGALEDACEAVIGALYLDGGMDVARAFVLNHWRERAQNTAAPPQDAKTALQEWTQAHGLGLPRYRMVEQTGPAHAPEFVIEVSVEGKAPRTASGTSKRVAEHLAAKSMLGHIKSTRGFTLVELAIVLVILGLIVGGVLLGKDLIKSAEIRSAISQFTRTQSAITAFRVKYNCLPGDCANAVSIWGRNSNITNDSCASINVAQSTAWNAAPYEVGTCNGDGNGVYDTSSGREQVVAWQQLSNAGLVEGNYKGGSLSGSGAANLTPDVHVPRAGLKHEANSSYGVPGENVLAINSPLIQSRYSPRTSSEIANWYNNEHYISLGSILLPGGASPNYISGGMFPSTAKEIDLKIDDGLPTTGLLLSETYGCAVGGGTTNEYRLGYTSFGDCSLHLLKAF